MEMPTVTTMVDTGPWGRRGHWAGVLSSFGLDCGKMVSCEALSPRPPLPCLVFLPPPGSGCPVVQGSPGLSDPSCCGEKAPQGIHRR